MIDHPDLRRTSKVATLTDRDRRWPAVVMIWQSSARYCGDKPFIALYNSTTILNSMRCRTGRQWRCLNTGVMCSHRLVPVMRRVTAFWTVCRCWTRLSYISLSHCHLCSRYIHRSVLTHHLSLSMLNWQPPLLLFFRHHHSSWIPHLYG